MYEDARLSFLLSSNYPNPTLDEAIRKTYTYFFLKLSEQFIMSKNSPLSMFSVNIIGK